MDRLELFRLPADDTAARAQRRRRRAGELVRVGYGIAASSSAYRTASESTRHRARIDAVVARSKSGLIVSHESAVVMHGLPWFGALPDRVVLTDRSRDRAQRLRFSDKVPAKGRPVSTAVIDGVLTTDLIQTAVDVALRCDRGHALVVADAVLRRGVEHGALLEALERRSPQRGSVRARRTLELADARRESAGESLTALVFHDVGLPAPELQHEFRDAGRFVARVDFWFPGHGVVVEFDGLAKYRERALLAGRSPGDVVVDEKRREDDIRSLPRVTGVARVIWRDVLPGGEAPEILRRAGLPVPLTMQRTPSW